MCLSLFNMTLIVFFIYVFFVDALWFSVDRKLISRPIIFALTVESRQFKLILFASLSISICIYKFSQFSCNNASINLFLMHDRTWSCFRFLSRFFIFEFFEIAEFDSSFKSWKRNFNFITFKFADAKAKNQFLSSKFSSICIILEKII